MTGNYSVYSFGIFSDAYYGATRESILQQYGGAKVGVGAGIGGSMQTTYTEKFTSDQYARLIVYLTHFVFP